MLFLSLPFCLLWDRDSGIVAGVLIALAAAYFTWDRWRKKRNQDVGFRLSQWFHSKPGDSTDPDGWSDDLLPSVGPATSFKKRPASSFFVGSRSEKMGAPRSPTIGGVAGLGAGGQGVKAQSRPALAMMNSSPLLASFTSQDDPFADFAQRSSTVNGRQLMTTNPDPASRQASTVHVATAHSPPRSTPVSPSSKYSTPTSSWTPRKIIRYASTRRNTRATRHLTSSTARTVGTDLYSIYGEAGSHVSTLTGRSESSSSIHSSVYGAYESLSISEKAEEAASVPPVPALPSIMTATPTHTATKSTSRPMAAMAASPSTTALVSQQQHRQQHPQQPPFRWGSMVLPM